MSAMRFLAVTVCALALSCGIANRAKAPEVPFGPDGIDFARLEHELPLAPADLMKITPANLELLTQEQVDQIYARLSAGPIPEGAFDGDFFFAQGEDPARLADIIGGRVRAHAFIPEDGEGERAREARRIRERLKAGVVDVKLADLESLGPALWKRKVFYREQRLLRNRIEDVALVGALVGEDPARIQQLKAGDDLFFPAKLYCGQSLLDGRRESVIVDYGFSDELPGYIEPIDRLVGRHGLQIRDEIRMVRPGFYLGRAYFNRVFGLNFTLYNDAAATAGEQDFRAGRVAEDCWPGSQVAQR